jgi:hypothetical protein
MADKRFNALQDTGVDPTSVGLRSRCNHCHLLRRTCRNGTTTRPCDRCREKGVLCTFTAPGSFVDKHIPGRGVRDRVTNCVITIPRKSVNKNDSLSSIINYNFQAVAYNDLSRTIAVQTPYVNPRPKQNRSLVEEPKVEHAPVEESKLYSQSNNFCIFTHEQIYFQQDSTMSAVEDLNARQKLGYKLMAERE